MSERRSARQAKRKSEQSEQLKTCVDKPKKAESSKKPKQSNSSKTSPKRRKVDWKQLTTVLEPFIVDEKREYNSYF